MSTTLLPHETDVLVVGAGPAGSAAAAWSARLGLETVLADAAVFPRDKPCGDGLTPRAVAEIHRLGLSGLLVDRVVNRGLRAAGFGQTLLLPWPGGSLPATGSAIPRTVLDEALRVGALADGATGAQGLRAVDVVRDGDRVAGVVFAVEGGQHTIACRRLVVADGVRSQLGRVLGRHWLRDTAYGVAARAYIGSARHDDPWISSHLELRGEPEPGRPRGELLSGYGWVFPLGDGEVNIGVGTLATERRPAEINLRRLTEHYTDLRREDWQLSGDLRMLRSAMLPMGGAVSGVSGPNWALVGDAAGCVNPLNGEGIDYGLETGRLVAELLAEGGGLDGNELDPGWAAILRTHYGLAFSIARRLAGLLTHPRLLPLAGPVGMRSTALMTVALRVMGNLVLESDTDVVARAWRGAGRVSARYDERPPFPASDLRR